LAVSILGAMNPKKWEFDLRKANLLSAGMMVDLVPLSRHRSQALSIQVRNYGISATLGSPPPYRAKIVLKITE
jgi:hypothetical protein